MSYCQGGYIAQGQSRIEAISQLIVCTACRNLYIDRMEPLYLVLTSSAEVRRSRLSLYSVFFYARLQQARPAFAPHCSSVGDRIRNASRHATRGDIALVFEDAAHHICRLTLFGNAEELQGFSNLLLVRWGLK